MSMTIDLSAPALAASSVLDSGGKRIGVVGRVYVDDQSGQPAFVTVDLSPLGIKHALAPLHGASVVVGEVTLAFDGEQVRSAPDVPEEQHRIDDDSTRLLRDHYSLQP